MRIPVIQGLIKRRLLVNFRADPDVVQRLLPQPFRPKLQGGHAIAGVCLIRLEEIRPSGVPAFLGLSSENAAHRIAVEWTDAAGKTQEGVFIPRRDTGSRLNSLIGGRLFPGEHSFAKFAVTDAGGHIELSMNSCDSSQSVRIVGDEADALPRDSCFSSLEEASAFFQGGCLGYSVTRDPCRLDGLQLQISGWRVRTLSVCEVASSFFADHNRFPVGSVEFDHALVMRDVPHEWRQAKDLYVTWPEEPRPLNFTSRRGIGRLS